MYSVCVRLGHDIFYLEDTNQWPYSPVTGGVADNCAFNVRYLGDAMSHFGLSRSMVIPLRVAITVVWSYRQETRRGAAFSGSVDQCFGQSG